MFGSFAESALLGIVHGVSEFLPISSDGHRALARILFKLEGGPTLDVLLRVASLAATVIVLWPEVARSLTDGPRSLVAPARFSRTPGARDAATVLWATIPTVAVTLLLRAPAARWTKSPFWIGLGFLASTAALVLGHFAVRGDRERPSILGAMLLGVAQGLAVLPGFSRSGFTIAVALLLGVKPLRAFELSFLISLPALILAIVLGGQLALAMPFPGPGAVVGGLAALLLGVMSLHLLRGAVVRGRLGWFALWVGPLALATLALGLAWPA
jgi:undecaprenyl-diphosphatase